MVILYVALPILHLFTGFLLIVWSLSACACNDRTRDQDHLQRRQALRNRQRDAVISGRSVRSVIDSEVESDETGNCPKMTCVPRMAPRLKELSGNSDVYERLNKNDEFVLKMEKEKPPMASMTMDETRLELGDPSGFSRSSVEEKVSSNEDN